MTLDFNETAIINQTLDTDDKGEYLQRLLSIKENTGYQELKDSLDSLYDKIFMLQEDEFKKLHADKEANKIFSFPSYRL